MAAISPAERKAGLTLIEQAATATQALTLETNQKNDQYAAAAAKVTEASKNKLIQTLPGVKRALDVAESQINVAKPNGDLEDPEVVLPALHFKGLAQGSLNFACVSLAKEGMAKDHKSFIEAVSTNNVPKAEEMMTKQGINPNYVLLVGSAGDLCPHYTRITALGLACIKGFPQMVKTIRVHGGDPNFAAMPLDSELLSTDLSPPYIMPAWLALLGSALSTEQKRAIWNEFDGKADPMMREGAKWWISRSFYSKHTQPEDIHMALQGINNSSKASMPHLNVLNDTFYDIPHRIAIAEEANGGTPVMSVEQRRVWNERTIQLGSVMIFNRVPIPPMIADAPSKMLTSTANAVTQWVTCATKSNGFSLTLIGAEQSKKQTEEQSTELILPEDANEAESLRMEISEKIQDVISVRPLINMIVQYLVLTPQQFSALVAQKCFDRFFAKIK